MFNTRWRYVWISADVVSRWALLPNKVKENHFKITNRYYPCNDFISTFKEGFSPLCSFCKEENETIVHLFFSCNYTNLFWSHVSWFLFELFYTFVTITEVMVLFMSYFPEVNVWIVLKNNQNCWNLPDVRLYRTR